MSTGKKSHKKKASSKKKKGAAGQTKPNKAAAPTEERSPDDLFADNLTRLAERRFRLATEEEAWRAQEMVYDAWDAEDELDAVDACLRAIEIDPACVDAYLLFLDALPPPEDVEMTILEIIVDAAAFILGPGIFEQETGAFWDLVETRPYMRARARLADALWSAGEYDDAVAHYEGLLDLDTTDHQGIRYRLLTSYLDMGEEKSAAALIDEYPEDDSPYWLYTRALLAFRERGDGEDALARLQDAARANPQIPDYLVGGGRLPPQSDSADADEPEEAVAYARDFRLIWRRVPGALAWLERSRSELPKMH